ncbi:DNA polymerase III sliding clamp beta subunit [Arthrobacter phage Shade]|uniref:DNA polymerase III sliding clamp beta subunit n=1 Tax=Arthrobacter phage Shade TaxID=2024283 RepID=A0A222Z8F7_9CAUD|nr:DNA polymerase processivity factor [Arthrobacter phage Shade]ASR80778.1 DNA polymerase III sliding clamp beta subunit [Arthrobacter phage Shade]
MTATLTEDKVQPVTKSIATAKVSDWLTALAIARLPLSRKAPVPILDCVKIVGAQGIITLTTDNYESRIDVVVKDSVSEDFEVLLPLLHLLDVIRACSDDKGALMTLEVLDFLDKRIAIIETGGFRMPIIAHFSNDEYPRSETVTGPASFSIAADALKTGVKRAAVAASKDDTLPILTAINFYADKAAGKLRMTSTDRYRLSFVNEDANIMHDAQFLINCELLMKLAPKIKQKEPVSVVVRHADPLTEEQSRRAHTYYSDSTRVKMIFEDFTLHTNGVNGDYPKVRELLSPAYDKQFTVSKAQLIRSAVVAERLSARHTPCTFELLGNKMRLKPNRDHLDEISRGLVSVPDVAMTPNAHAPLEVCVNPSYLLPALRAFTGDAITFSFVENLAKPFLISSDENHTDAQFNYLMMPIRMPS